VSYRILSGTLDRQESGVKEVRIIRTPLYLFCPILLGLCVSFHISLAFKTNKYSNMKLLYLL